MPATTTSSLVDCTKCGTLHRNDVKCPWSPDGISSDVAMKVAFAEREAAQEREAFAAKMARDQRDARPAPRRVNRVNSIGTKLDTPAKGKTPWAAKFPGTCANCHTAIELGDMILRADGKGYRHVDCPAPRTSTTTRPATTPARTASDKQINLITTLQVERGVPAEAPEGLTFSEASDEISRLIAMPKISAGKTRIDLNGLREGRYAVNTEAGVLAFYNVTKRGVFVQASDALHMVPGAAAMQSIIAKILVDPAEAARTYGRKLGKCAVCGRTLTDEDSRAHGIGPICRKKTGW